MKALASILLLLSLAAIAAAQTYTAYSVTNIQPSADSIVVTVNVTGGRATAHRSNAAEWSNGDVLNLSVYGCEGTPVKGENGIIAKGPNGWSILTSGGATCRVTQIAFVPPKNSK